MSLISAIREFFLGPPLQFHHQKTILETIYAQLNNARFAYLLIVVSIISIVAIIIRISRLNKQTGILPFVVCAILIYSGYCLERSFRVGVDMDAENVLKGFLSNGLRKSSLMASSFYEGKVPLPGDMSSFTSKIVGNNESNTEQSNQKSHTSLPRNSRKMYGKNQNILSTQQNKKLVEQNKDKSIEQNSEKSNEQENSNLNQKNEKQNEQENSNLNQKNEKSNEHENLSQKNDDKPNEQTNSNLNLENLNQQNIENSSQKINQKLDDQYSEDEEFDNKQEAQSSSETTRNKDTHMMIADSHIDSPSMVTDLVQSDNPNGKIKRNVEIKVVKPGSSKDDSILKPTPSQKDESKEIPDPYLPAAEESTSTPNEPEKTKEKKVTFDDTFEQKDFLHGLKKTINKKESAISKAKELLSDLKKTGSFIREDLEKFEENFNEFLKNSAIYKNILIKADISPDLYKIDLEDLKQEIESRLEIIPLLEKFIKVSRNGKTGLIDKMKSAFTANSEWQPLKVQSTEHNSEIGPSHNSLRNITQDVKLAQDLLEDQNVPMRKKERLIDESQEPANTSESKDRNKINSDLSERYGLSTNLLLRNNFLSPFTNRVYLTEKEHRPTDETQEKSSFDVQETENLTFIQAFMVIQGIICLVIFILMICNLLNIIPACKLILLVILIGNVFIGILSMIYAQALAKRCIIMDVPNCQNRNLFDVEEVVDILNEREEPKTENAINFIEKKFKENFDDLSISVDKLENYMKGNESKAIHKIDVFRNMINKLMFIESDFEPTSKFFSPIYTMKRYLEDLKHQILLITNKSLFPIYRELLEAQVFFDDHKETISSRIENFLKLNMKRKEDKANDNCKKEMKKICKARKDYDQLAFALVVFGMIFVILVCF